MTPLISEKERERLIVERMQKCVHFTGIGQPTCKAGVAYDSVRVAHEQIPYERDGVKYSRGASFPCVASLNLCGATCEKLQLHTREQATERLDQMEQSMARQFKARSAIVDATGRKPGSGSLPCPNDCGGTLYYGIAPNKHIHAHCSTKGCCAWME